jgi:dCTP deaminase
LRVQPYDPLAIQPSSVDIRLDGRFRIFRSTRYTHIDPRQEQPDLTELVTVSDGEAFVLQPGQFCLGNTWEEISLPDDLVARLEGKSSLGRLGLVIHSTAGYVDPGFRGHLTLELSNAASLPIQLYPRMKIGQLSFIKMTTPAERPYGSQPLGSKYQGQTEPTASRIHLDFADRTPQ